MYPLENEPRWVTLAMALEIHRKQISRFGGSDGVRDQRLLESALFRPRNVHHYEGPVSLPQLAASYCFGVSRNHPFVDGNKRVSFVVATVFLLMNGVHFRSTENDVVETMLAVANGAMDEAELTNWFSAHLSVP